MKTFLVNEDEDSKRQIDHQKDKKNKETLELLFEEERQAIGT